MLFNKAFTPVELVRAISGEIDCFGYVTNIFLQETVANRPTMMSMIYLFFFMIF